ncbi:MAG: PDZ domain-containing protein [Acidimicrobiia bacterium]
MGDTIRPVSDQSPPKPQRSLTAAAIVFFVLGLVVLAWNIPLPLVAWSPGPVGDASAAVIVEGHPVQQPHGELLMLTVESQPLNAFEAVVAGIDPTVDVLARNRVRKPGVSDEQYQRLNLQMMDQSTATAITVALSKLNLEAQADKVFITGYAASTPAGKVLRIGDQITAIEGKKVTGVDDLAPALAGKKPGDTIRLTVLRSGEEHTYDIELAENPDTPGQAFIGIFIRQLPFWIDVNPGIVGGPSAGMMYTLAIIETLSNGDLAHGHVVAGTGTISPDGKVGAIGGVRQKVVAAEAAGAEYMLVPQANYDAAMTAPRHSMELKRVSTIDDALAFLASLPAA